MLIATIGRFFVNKEKACPDNPVVQISRQSMNERLMNVKEFIQPYIIVR